MHACKCTHIPVHCAHIHKYVYTHVCVCIHACTQTYHHHRRHYWLSQGSNTQGLWHGEGADYVNKSQLKYSCCNVATCSKYIASAFPSIFLFFFQYRASWNNIYIYIEREREREWVSKHKKVKKNTYLIRQYTIIIVIFNILTFYGFGSCFRPLAVILVSLLNFCIDRLLSIRICWMCAF